MATLDGNLWAYNLARVIVVDVSDDYRLMQSPMPSDFYPVLGEMWLPKFNIKSHLTSLDGFQGYLYDWHESSYEAAGEWYVGVVRESLAHRTVEA